MSSYAGHAADCFPSITQKLTAYNINMHIGAYSRVYNDYGSITRDREERNLNSKNFPEFFADETVDADGADKNGGLDPKTTLLCTTKYERQCAAHIAKVLSKSLTAEGVTGKKVADYLHAYLGYSEQFADMYVMRDVTNRVK
ncbi:hypothetical protein MMC17_000631 [Xylographa soralifera]|nr:hypothetical protein [Xylographa soralifera]